MRSRRVWLTASSCAVLLLAGCGSSGTGPRLPAQFARAAAEQADRIATLLDDGRACEAEPLARRILRSAIAAINARRIPPPLQEELLGRANELVAVVPCRRAGDADLAGSRARDLAEWLRSRA